MKSGFLLSFTVMIVLLLYGSSMLKQKMPSEEEMQEYIGKIKSIKELSTSPAGDLTDEQRDILAGLQQSTGRMADMQASEGTGARMNEALGYDPSELAEVHAPIMKKLINMFGSDRSLSDNNEAEGYDIEAESYDKRDKSYKKVNIDIYLKYLNFSRLHMHYGNYYLIAGILIFAFSLIFNISGVYPLVSLIAKLGFFIGRFSLIIASVAAVLFWLLFKCNLWLDAGINTFLGPIEILIGACAALKSFDPNFPIWNRLLVSMILPFLSALFLIGGNMII